MKLTTNDSRQKPGGKTSAIDDQQLSASLPAKENQVSSGSLYKLNQVSNGQANNIIMAQHSSKLT